MKWKCYGIWASEGVSRPLSLLNIKQTPCDKQCEEADETMEETERAVGDEKVLENLEVSSRDPRNVIDAERLLAPTPNCLRVQVFHESILQRTLDQLR